jgi:hypothetical protein
MPLNPGQSRGQNQNPQFFGQQPLLPQQTAGGWEMPPNMNAQSAMNMPEYTPASSPPLRKFYTFQRVNGNGGNGKGDGVAGPHKHSLEESDRVKKNSVIRWQAKVDKDGRKKSQVSLFKLILSQTPHFCCTDPSSHDQMQRRSTLPAHQVHTSF